MTLIAIIFVLTTEQYWRCYPFATVFIRLVTFSERMRERFAGQGWFEGAAGAVLLLLPGVALVALIQWFLGLDDGLLAGALGMAFSVVVLALCVGDRWFSDFVKNYIKAWRQGDIEGANLYLQKVSYVTEAIDNPRQLNRRFLELMLERANERILALLFWFAVLGPVGAVMYRTLCQMKGGLIRHQQQGEMSGLDEALLHLKAILDWVPVRLTVIGYAIMGSFMDVVHAWQTQDKNWTSDWNARNCRLLDASGLAALQIEGFYHDEESELALDEFEHHVTSLRAMVRRVMFAGITVLAILTLVGWLS